MVMTICRTILAKLGYNVLEAETGARAISIAKSYPHTIDLALLDISLPDMSGNSLYPVLMDARPNLRVLVCSGHSIDGPGEELISAGAEGFLQKPFSIAMLSEKLRQVFGAK